MTKASGVANDRDNGEFILSSVVGKVVHAYDSTKLQEHI